MLRFDKYLRNNLKVQKLVFEQRTRRTSWINRKICLKTISHEKLTELKAVLDFKNQGQSNLLYCNFQFRRN